MPYKDPERKRQWEQARRQERTARRKSQRRASSQPPRTTFHHTLTEESALKIDYTAKTDKATALNLTNHSYFNLAGGGDVLGYRLTLNASRYTPVDSTLIPTGELAPVKGTAYDFTKPMSLGAHTPELAKIKEAGGVSG